MAWLHIRPLGSMSTSIAGTHMTEEPHAVRQGCGHYPHLKVISNEEVGTGSVVILCISSVLFKLALHHGDRMAQGITIISHV